KYTRKLSVCKAFTTFFANASWSDATATKVGLPAATSLAKDGPVISAVGTSSPKMSIATSCRKRPAPGSKPLLAHDRGRPFNNGFIRIKISPNACEGQTTRTASDVSIASSKSVCNDRFGGKG